MLSIVWQRQEREKLWKEKSTTGEKSFTAWMESWIGIRKFETSWSQDKKGEGQLAVPKNIYINKMTGTR